MAQQSHLYYVMEKLQNQPRWQDTETRRPGRHARSTAGTGKRRHCLEGTERPELNKGQFRGMSEDWGKQSTTSEIILKG